MSFFALFAKIWPTNMYHSSKSRNLFVWPSLPGDLRWPWPILWSQSTGNDAYKCQRHYPMPIRWPCLSLTSKFCSSMSRPSPKSRTFWLWPDLWRYWWPEVIKIYFPSTLFHGFQMPLEFLESVQQFRRSEGARNSPPPPSAPLCYKNTSVERGLKN